MVKVADRDAKKIRDSREILMENRRSLLDVGADSGELHKVKVTFFS
jgi:hypothetical protein